MTPEQMPEAPTPARQMPTPPEGHDAPSKVDNLGRQGSNKVLLLAVAFGVALLLGAGLIFVGLGKL